MFDGLVRRQGLVFARSEWLQIAQRDASSDAWVGLSSIMVQIPTMLEAADEAAHSMTLSSPNDALPLVSNAIRLCQHARAALNEWYATLISRSSAELCSLIEPDQLRHFAENCDDRTFKTVFTFPSLHIATLISTYWFGVFVLARELAQLQQLAGGMNATYQLPSAETLAEEVTTAANCLCQCMPFCCEPDIANAAGRVHTLLVLWFAKDFFSHMMRWPQHSWCVAVEQMIEQTGLRSPTPPSQPV
ncbi:MAG: hypothetical protein M1828_006587 [Chrysothrix sp. TS-e1954]|nr:MAG: hypothetical protein M1828_006587 [Chrysothrix sp. TS-e1954]